MSTIIVVDDDAVFRKMMKRSLIQMGFSVVETNSGKGMDALILQHRPTACLIDIVMDEKEGIETILEISRDPHRPRLVAVSSEPLYLSLALDMGADAVLTKPVTPVALKGTLDRLGIAPA